MTAQNILAYASRENLTAALIAPQDVPVDYKFRQFCEQNLCGNYGANYACPRIAEHRKTCTKSYWPKSRF